MDVLTFDLKPPFQVDLHPYAPIEQQEDPNLSTRIQKIVYLPFQLIKITFISLLEGFYTVLSHSWVSFKLEVLGYYGSLYNFRPPKTLPLAIFKVAVWILNMARCFFEYTIQGLGEKWNPIEDHSILKPHLQDLHPEQFQTNQKSIDVSHVPESVQVSNLLKMFDNNKPGSLGYIDPGEATRKNLEEFVKNIELRNAFIGTPPKHDTPRLLAFYQQIENALRFSIHKLEQDLANAENPVAKRDCEEEINRFAIDMALAGSRCGAAYMGEAMDAHDRISETGIGVEETLQTTLYEILAGHRKKIARGQVSQHLGEDVHGYGKYMQALGSILAIPGSENIIEHLETLQNRDKYLRLFFKKYTEDSIIGHINEQIKTSQPLREKITTWIQEQAANWDQGNVDRQVLELTQQINQLSKDAHEIKMTSLYQSLRVFQDLIIQYQESPPSVDDWDDFPSTDDWKEFIEALFCLDTSKKVFKQTFPNLTNKDPKKQREAIAEKHKLKRALQEESIGKELLEHLRTAIKQKTLIIEEDQLVLSICAKKDWVFQAQKISGINLQTLGRVYLRQTSVKDAVEGHVDRIRRVSFLESFDLDNIELNGISPKLMEWLLVSHKIFYPQG